MTDYLFTVDQKTSEISDLTITAIIATSDLRPPNNSYNSDSEKTLLKLSAMYLIVLYSICKL